MFGGLAGMLGKVGSGVGDYFANNPKMLEALQQTAASFGGDSGIGQIMGGISSGIQTGLKGRAQDKAKKMGAAQANAPVATQTAEEAGIGDTLTPPPLMGQEEEDPMKKKNPYSFADQYGSQNFLY